MTIAIDTAGLHPATELCLEALQWLQQEREFHRVLDMGCGNGILSVVSATIWDADVMAVDISAKAVEDTRQMLAQETLGARVTAIRSDGFGEPAIGQNAPYDLIIFNMLAEPVVQMAPDVKSHLAPGGICVIGGLLEWKASATLEVYTMLGFEKIREFTAMPWHLYVLRLAGEN
jgi:ribosomal protein L11 methyltransferase